MDWLRILKLDSLRDVWLRILAPAIWIFVGSTGMGTYIFGFDGMHVPVQNRESVGRLLLFLSALGLAGIVIGLWLRAVVRRRYTIN